MSLENELNMDGIHIDIDETIKKYNGKIHSVSDCSTIQQIALFCQHNRNDYRKSVLLDMINPQYAFAGLYPHVMKTFDVLPDKKL